MFARKLMKIDTPRTFTLLSLALLLLLSVASCQQEDDQAQQDQPEMEGRQAQGDQQIYRADLSGVNQELTETEVQGTATLAIANDSVTITLDASGLPAGMMHMAHYHGFTDGQEATCPSPDADENGDGIIDMTEATQVIGQPLVPFNNDPTNLSTESQTYPTADSMGNLYYTQTVSLEELRNAMQQEHGITELDFSNFVVNIHGVDEGNLPQSVQSQPGMPPHLTVPIACGKLEEVQGGEQASIPGNRRTNGRTNGQTNGQSQQPSGDQSNDR